MKPRRRAITPKMLARAIEEATGCGQARSELAIQRLSDRIIAEIKAGNEVRIDRVCVLYASVRGAYEQNVPLPPRNRVRGDEPSSEKRMVPAMLVPRFRAVPALKRALRS